MLRPPREQTIQRISMRVKVCNFVVVVLLVFRPLFSVAEKCSHTNNKAQMTDTILLNACTFLCIILFGDRVTKHQILLVAYIFSFTTFFSSLALSLVRACALFGLSTMRTHQHRFYAGSSCWLRKSLKMIWFGFSFVLRTKQMKFVWKIKTIFMIWISFVIRFTVWFMISRKWFTSTRERNDIREERNSKKNKRINAYSSSHRGHVC